MADQGAIGKREVDWSMCTHDPKEIEAILSCVADVYIREMRAGRFNWDSFYRRRAEKQRNLEARGR